MKAKTASGRRPSKVKPLADKDRLELFRMMVRIREFEEKVHDSFVEGLVHGTTHLCQGQEAVSVGTGLALRDGRLHRLHISRPWPLHRPRHGRGAPSPSCSAAAPASRRRRRLDAPHRHRQGPDRRLRHRRRRPAGRGRRGRHRPLERPRPALGDLLRRRRDQHRRLPRIHEHRRGLEAAGAVHLREQPLRRVHAASTDSRPCEDLVERAPAATTCAAVRSTATTSRRSTRRPPRPSRAPAPASGPTFIECMTYRQRGHSRTDAGKYRPTRSEVEAWLERDPIKLYRGGAGQAEAAHARQGRRR